MGLAAIKPYQWQKGQSGNPAGRPVGARVKFSEAFLQDFHESWVERGQEVIQTVIEKDPAAYLRIAAGLLPRIDLGEEEQNVTRERVKRAISTIESWIAASGAEGSGSGTGEPGTAE